MNEKCPTCGSPSPGLHPAMQSEGEVQPCADAWHGARHPLAVLGPVHIIADCLVHLIADAVERQEAAEHIVAKLEAAGSLHESVVPVRCRVCGTTNSSVANAVCWKSESGLHAWEVTR